MRRFIPTGRRVVVRIQSPSGHIELERYRWRWLARRRERTIRDRIERFGVEGMNVRVLEHAR